LNQEGKFITAFARMELRCESTTRHSRTADSIEISSVVLQISQVRLRTLLASELTPRQPPASIDLFRVSYDSEARWSFIVRSSYCANAGYSLVAVYWISCCDRRHRVRREQKPAL